MLSTSIYTFSDQDITALEPLPFPIYFITKDVAKWHDLLDKEDLPDNLQELFWRSSNGNDILAVQTYIELKRRGLNVYLTSHFIPGQICIAPYHYIAIRDFNFNSYVVACRDDSARPELCEQQTVPNYCGVKTSKDHFIPVWPQPNLKPRDPKRDTTLENLDFKGDVEHNLAWPFKTPEFIGQLASLGIQLVHSSTDLTQRLIDFTDYTRSDAILAIRNTTASDLMVKPAIKLVNAWFGGCPAILGPEPAYQALRRSELDYFEVRNPEEALNALRRLKAEPNLYRAMVENGFRRAQDFTTDKIALRWYEFLSGPVLQGYQDWLNQSLFQKKIGRPVQYIFRVQAHRRAIKEYLIQRDNGHRLFPEPDNTETQQLERRVDELEARCDSQDQKNPQKKGSVTRPKSYKFMDFLQSR